MEPYVSCPYDPAHRVPRSRFQRHIIKCEKNYPALEICPYNATHRYPKGVIIEHVAKCPDKEQFLIDRKPENCNTMLTTPQPIKVSDYISADDPDYEDWDN